MAKKIQIRHKSFKKILKNHEFQSNSNLLYYCFYSFWIQFSNTFTSCDLILWIVVTINEHSQKHFFNYSLQFKNFKIHTSNGKPTQPWPLDLSWYALSIVRPSNMPQLYSRYAQGTLAHNTAIGSFVPRQIPLH